MIVWQQTCTRMRPQGTRSGWYLFSEYLYREDCSIFLLENRDFQAFLWWGMSCNNNHHHFTGRPTWRLLANLSGVFLNNSIKNSLLEIQSFPSMELYLGVLWTGYHLMGTHSAKGHWSIYTTVFISWNLYFYFAPKQLMRFISNQKVGKRMNPCDSYLCMF